jgi:TMEM175 potassium channel family protein
MTDDAGLVEDELPEERGFDYARTVALSDGVFAIALTLLVLNISFPTLASGHHGQIGHELLKRKGEFGAYALSFAVIALLWVRHHSFMRGLEVIDTTMTVLNLAYLGFVAFLPYPTRVLGVYGGESAAVVLYATTNVILASIAALMRIHAERAGLLSPLGRVTVARREHWAITPAVFAGSIPIAFASPTAAKLLWLLLLVRPRR